MKILSTVIILNCILYRPIGCPEILANIISQCTTIEPEDRLTFTEILECYKRKQDTTTATSDTIEQSVDCIAETVVRDIMNH